MKVRVVLALVVGAAWAAGALVAPQKAGELTFDTANGDWKTTTEAGQRVLTIHGTAASAGAPAPTAFPLATVKEIKNFRAGTIRAEFKLIGGASDQTAGIVFGLRPDGTYHFARYNTKDGNVAIWVFQNGGRKVIQHGEVHKQLALNQWHDLSVTIKDMTVTVSADKGALQATRTFTAPIQGGIGFWTKADSVTAFRGLDVTPR